jgi:hypothetical protein
MIKTPYHLLKSNQITIILWQKGKKKKIHFDYLIIKKFNLKQIYKSQ